MGRVWQCGPLSKAEGAGCFEFCCFALSVLFLIVYRPCLLVSLICFVVYCGISISGLY